MHWLYLNRNFESRFKGFVVPVEAVRQVCTQLDKRWVHGIGDCRRFLLLLNQRKAVVKAEPYNIIFNPSNYGYPEILSALSTLAASFIPPKTSTLFETKKPPHNL
ncbi:hypothetical protein [Microbulbifer epialgicus]|uniref:Uncharacterized protein n=1 Tax=Microbulbifer epialgicus TaxID=393907 RepID=A0ABV4NUZ4_9GAMM